MRIAVISDSHDRLPPAVLTAIAEADEIWHLGDVCAPFYLEQVEMIGPPVRIVRGNCDSTQEWPESITLDLEGFRILLIHIPPKYLEPEFDLVLHGHTHVPRDERVGAIRFLNPGCLTRPNRGAPASFAWLVLRHGKTPEWTLQRI
jgi:uncharacterized protein